MADDSQIWIDGGDLTGQVLDGRFEIIRQLGAGAMGQIYLARQLGLDAWRAIKVIKAGLQYDVDMEARFRREARALSRLNHSNIVLVIDYGRISNEAQYLVLEYVDGPDLRSEIKKRGPLSVARAVTVLAQLVAGLEYAHQEGIVHRDLKPENIILQEGDVGRVKIIDFGLAKLVGDDEGTVITKDNEVLGTPQFMAPEQCNAKAIGPPTDIYALGGVGYFLLSGQAVFQTKSVMEMILAHTFEIPERLSARCPEQNVPSELDGLLLKCLEKEPGQRPTAAEVADGLERVFERMQQPPSPSQMRRRAARKPADEADLASKIWTEAWSARRNADESEEAVSYREAVFNQITSVLVDLAQELLAHLHVSESISIQMAQIDRIKDTLTNLQLDVALMDSQLGDLAGQESQEAERVKRQLRLIRGQAMELSQGINREYRLLFRYVLSCRTGVVDPELLALYDELDMLIDQYLRTST